MTFWILSVKFSISINDNYAQYGRLKSINSNVFQLEWTINCTEICQQTACAVGLLCNFSATRRMRERAESAMN